jgi:Zn-dependent protease with chaperone function
MLTGTYFPAGSSRSISARASVSEMGLLTIVDESGAVLVEIALKKVRASERLGNLRRRLELPDGGYFETSDNDGVDSMLRAGGRRRHGALIDRLESSLRWMAVSVVVAAITITLMIFYGFPAAADWLAWHTPRAVLVTISGQTLNTMDRFALEPSQLKPADKRRASTLFARVATAGAQGKSAYRLLFREGHMIGPNAFSLPDGTIVMTDELYVLAMRDDELEGVFGHEIAHADRRHVLQLLYEGSLLPAAIALITGDASQFGQIAAVLPTILIQSSYSRAAEQQADDDSAAMMKRIGADPAALGDFLLRLERNLCGKKGCSEGWLGSHPDAAVRAARLRQEGRPPSAGPHH